jgi:hypothetical protein
MQKNVKYETILLYFLVLLLHTCTYLSCNFLISFHVLTLKCEEVLAPIEHQNMEIRLTTHSNSEYSITSTIRTLVNRIGLALRVNLSRILQN